MRQIYPDEALLDDAGLAAQYACPDGAAGSPWLRANMVASLDGAATLLGRSGGLSGEADQQVFAMLRRDGRDGEVVAHRAPPGPAPLPFRPPPAAARAAE